MIVINQKTKAKLSFIVIINGLVILKILRVLINTIVELL